MASAKSNGRIASSGGGRSLLTVGVTDAPPWIVRDGARAVGPEAELVLEFARSIGAAVEWRFAPQDEQLEALQCFELDVVAAGLRGDSPWAARVGLTQPWRRDGEVEHVLAVPPGENETIVALERLILRRRAGSP